MDKTFFDQKISQLTNEQLIQLLQLNTDENATVMEIAREEADRKGLEVNVAAQKTPEHEPPNPKRSWVQDFLFDLLWMS